MKKKFAKISAFQNYLVKHSACTEGRTWSAGMTAKKAIRKLKNIYWMAWLWATVLQEMDEAPDWDDLDSDLLQDFLLEVLYLVVARYEGEAKPRQWRTIKDKLKEHELTWEKIEQLREKYANMPSTSGLHDAIWNVIPNKEDYDFAEWLSDVAGSVSSNLVPEKKHSKAACDILAELVSKKKILKSIKTSDYYRSQQ